eukprot:CAMPEP_0181335374 /NCGR_PEP_ID=MMETSP1101-20121128/26795_1 /TAXON_ID=46948 /ORGANISM="Rhodomonas abbreviata, Strain Caron Lab Isolate" /LENGTH=209 /DNA_ID=CAMNT_0023445485 /DNA_START=15 /DNA_END=644 /DNA_ORIENTATION=+
MNCLTPLKIDDEFPRLKLKSPNGEQVKLFAEGRRKLVVFYRGYFCRFCMQSLKEINDRASTLSAAGVDVVAVSSDCPEVAETMVRDLGLQKISIACDLSEQQMHRLGLFVSDRLSPKHSRCCADEFGCCCNGRGNSACAKIGLRNPRNPRASSEDAANIAGSRLPLQSKKCYLANCEENRRFFAEPSHFLLRENNTIEDHFIPDDLFHI